MRLKAIICDKCGQLVKVANKIKIYNNIYEKSKTFTHIKVNKPRRNEYDLCEGCRLDLISWLEKKKNEEDKKSFLRRLLEVK